MVELSFFLLEGFTSIVTLVPYAFELSNSKDIIYSSISSIVVNVNVNINMLNAWFGYLILISTTCKGKFGIEQHIALCKTKLVTLKVAQRGAKEVPVHW